ncbi:MAG: phosphatidylglycerolprolipoprotein diacylglycerol [Planctomycetota bacterium]|nr:MAG: phosphatidylglycerolprolipoprotein diacylglycerol [Planctomycetota bacterium]
MPLYTAFVALGFGAAALLTWLRHRNRGFDFDAVFTMALVACVAGLVGARAWYVATHLSVYGEWFRNFSTAGMDVPAGLWAGLVAVGLLVLYARQLLRPLGPGPGVVALLSAGLITALFAARIAALHGRVDADPFDPRGGGLAFFGGLTLAVPACALVARSRGIPFGAAADATSPGLLAACALGRVGCFLNGCCTGIAVKGPFCPGDRVPTQLIEATVTAALAFALLAFAPPPRSGRTAAIAALAYCATRFGLEFLRDEPRVLPGLTASQAASLALAALVATWLALRRPQPDPSPASA